MPGGDRGGCACGCTSWGRLAGRRRADAMPGTDCAAAVPRMPQEGVRIPRSLPLPRFPARPPPGGCCWRQSASAAPGLPELRTADGVLPDASRRQAVPGLQRVPGVHERTLARQLGFAPGTRTPCDHDARCEPVVQALPGRVPQEPAQVPEGERGKENLQIGEQRPT